MYNLFRAPSLSVPDQEGLQPVSVASVKVTMTAIIRVRTTQLTLPLLSPLDSRFTL